MNDNLHWLANMNSFRLTTVKNTMLIYVHSFRVCDIHVNNLTKPEFKTKF